MAGTVDIYGTIHSMAVGTPAVNTDEVYDKSLGQMQHTLNQMFNDKLDSITQEEFNAIFT